MRWQSGQVAVAFAALVLGVMIALQFRLQRIVPPPTATGQLLTLLKNSDQKKAQLVAEVAHLNMLLDQKLTQVAAARRLSAQLIQAEMLAGTIPVKGPGITVVWGNGQAPSGYQLTDIDLLLMVNELRAAGAEAIAINGQRITAQTEIRSAANYILINGSQQGAPFTIQAIGNPGTLKDALTLPGGLFDQSQQEGRVMSISEIKVEHVPAGPPLLVNYTHPVSP
ncbi:MAG: DUF881 domain-containing protein [Sulfobacillus benefaciens]|uniref:DUF881 domain-containing protein n=1 Tax=Sulfobacillus benefaciens TaxID=453960 RepID=A0A2T2XJZ6_9FIRM|nr:MAG: DUF881 domain-containing protein [Sulfobacillus benefaciens]